MLSTPETLTLALTLTLTLTLTLALALTLAPNPNPNPSPNQAAVPQLFRQGWTEAEDKELIRRQHATRHTPQSTRHATAP